MHRKVCASTYKRWIGRDESASTITTMPFPQFILHRFRRLNNPMSSHLPFEWALSISARLGLPYACMKALLPARIKVERRLISRCRPVLSRDAPAQSPRQMVLKSGEAAGGLLPSVPLLVPEEDDVADAAL